MAKTNAQDESDCIQLIAENFQQRAQAFAQVTKLRSTHGGVSGSSRETIWADLLREVLPHKFSLVQNVVLIDSQGQHSCEIDVAAIDEQYTPYVFRCGEVKFVPIEAVALVMECKSTGSNNEDLKNWKASIAKLIPSPYGIARMATGYAIGATSTTQKATRPLRVFAAFHSKGDDRPPRYLRYLSTSRRRGPQSNHPPRRQTSRLVGTSVKQRERHDAPAGL